MELGARVRFKDSDGSYLVGYLESWHSESGTTSYRIKDKAGFIHNVFKDPSWNLNPEVEEITSSIDYIID